MYLAESGQTSKPDRPLFLDKAVSYAARCAFDDLHNGTINPQRYPRRRRALQQSAFNKSLGQGVLFFHVLNGSVLDIEIRKLIKRGEVEEDGIAKLRYRQNVSRVF